MIRKMIPTTTTTMIPRNRPCPGAIWFRISWPWLPPRLRLWMDPPPTFRPCPNCSVIVFRPFKPNSRDNHCSVVPPPVPKIMSYQHYYRRRGPPHQLEPERQRIPWPAFWETCCNTRRPQRRRLLLLLPRLRRRRRLLLQRNPLTGGRRQRRRQQWPFTTRLYPKLLLPHQPRDQQRRFRRRQPRRQRAMIPPWRPLLVP